MSSERPDPRAGDPGGPLLVADTPWLLYRAFFALPSSIRDGEGRPVNALLGTANALLAVVESLRPRAVVACFGAEEATYRVASFPGYHAHRDPMPPELRRQFEVAPALLAGFGWQVADAGGLEADDLLGAFASVEADAGGETRLLTADRDMYQCVDAHTAVLHLKGQATELVDGAEVERRYGVAPAQVPDFIALRGDPSDGIPGAPGIGAKTAASLLRRFGSLEALLEEAARAERAPSELRPKLTDTLRTHADQLRAFREIATLQPIAVRRPADNHVDPAAAAAAAAQHGMGALARRLASEG